MVIFLVYYVIQQVKNEVATHIIKQLSGSCTFYSLYYLIRILLSLDIFDHFIMYVKNDLPNSFIYSIKNESIHKLESTIYIHIALILLKDDLEFNRKDELINFVMKSLRMDYYIIKSCEYENKL